MMFRPPESVVKNVRSIRLTNLVFLFSSPPLIPSETSCVGPGSTAKEREQGLRPKSLTWNGIPGGRRTETLAPSGGRRTERP